MDALDVRSITKSESAPPPGMYQFDTTTSFNSSWASAGYHHPYNNPRTDNFNNNYRNDRSSDNYRDNYRNDRNKSLVPIHL